MNNPYAESAEFINLQGHAAGNVECECHNTACLQFGCARDQIVAQYDVERRPPPEYTWKDAVLWLLLCAVGAGAAWAWRVMA